ncbi:MAG: hypothetical protein B7733_14995 [Myxococcales bacterium FL481]|nr:MAG: hypothetical protein B7733_14995 [Myxococcales bacterium FL481]
MATPEGIRCRSDQHLRDKLLAAHDIRSAIESIERERGETETRRRLLAASIRLTRSLAPGVHRVVDSCCERLGFSLPLELFVYPSASFNAAAARPEHGRGFVLLASSLLEAFEHDELAFVIGHELGHHAFDHHEIPVGLLLSPKVGVSASRALQLFAWSRFAEISADRAGLYCCRELDAAGRALFKLASGLRRPLTDRVIDAMLDQMTDIEAAGDGRETDVERQDWLSTHPFSPLRIKAGKLFTESAIMRDGGLSLADLELRVEELLAVMEVGYLKASTDEAKAMRRLLLAAGMLIITASGGIDEREAEALDELLGDGTVTKKLDVAALQGDLGARIDAVVALTTPARRAQLVRDLCFVAQADGCTSEAERSVLENVAGRLGLGQDALHGILSCTYDLD